mgnify:CR=1 FL=1
MSMHLAPQQMRMARAALKLTLRDLAFHIGVSAQYLSRLENGAAEPDDTAYKIKKHYERAEIVFGPSHTVSVNRDVVSAERELSEALWQLCTEQGVWPSSHDLRMAHARFQKQLKNQVDGPDRVK